MMPPVSAPHLRGLRAFFLIVPGVILLGCFIIVCVRTESIWPWPYVVHEDGKRTLTDTVFYFEHAARELPLDILLGIVIGATVFYAFPGTGYNRPGLRRRNTMLAAGITALTIGVIIAGTAATGGISLVMDNLLQNHTRPGAPLLWGSHWRYHLLERSSLILLSIGFGGLLRACDDGRRDQQARAGFIWAFASLVGFAALTALFSLGPQFLLQSFQDPQYLGHQARDFFTHASVTLPLGWGVCMALLPKSDLTLSSALPSPGRFRSAGIRATIGAGITGMVIAAFLVIAAFAADAVSHGQSHDLITLIVPHYFEHSLDYLLIPAVSALAYELISRRSMQAAVADDRVASPG